jgi:hypothetical protein
MTNTKPETKIRQAREATVRAHADADNRHDPDATVATFSDSKASYDIPAFRRCRPGTESQCHLSVVCGMFSVFLNFHIEARPLAPW